MNGYIDSQLCVNANWLEESSHGISEDILTSTRQHRISLQHYRCTYMLMEDSLSYRINLLPSFLKQSIFYNLILCILKMQKK